MVSIPSLADSTDDRDLDNMGTPEQQLAQLQQMFQQQQQHMSQQQKQIEQLTAILTEKTERKNTDLTFGSYKQLMPAKPDTYSGQRRIAADGWIFNLEQYFRATGGSTLSDGFKINFAAAHFRDAAATWWRRQQQQISISTEIGIQESLTGDNNTTSWKAFKETFLRQFLPVSTKDTARAILHNLKQRSNVAGYCDEFNKVLIQLDSNDMSEGDQIYLFKKGLNKDMAQMLLLTQPKTLPEAMMMVVKFEAENPHRNTHRGAGGYWGGTHTNNNKQQSTQQHTSSSTPMELGRMQNSNDTERESGDESGGETEEQSVNAMGRRLTPEEVEEYKKRGKCFTCGKFGHLSRNCPTKGIKPQAQQKKL